MKNEIVLYRPNELAEHIEVKIDEETVWLSQQQMAVLFNQSKQNISLHITNCFKENELEKQATVKESLTVQKEGKRSVNRKIEYYNLDVIISVGYRVKSKQGTQFRIWANKILKDYLLKGYAINNRMNRLEDNVEALSTKVNQIDLQINTHLIPTQGVFFDGQVFDAYILISKIIGLAKKSIALIDNYVDESVLVHLSKKNKDVSVTILTNNINKQLQLDVQKANAQYPTITIKQFSQSHDRFLIIDKTEVYHLGASLKDLGKKWFAFSKMDKNSVQNILTSILELI
ncbi:MAG: RhuM family protein [Limnohabitans sp.]|nr:RhuM family protein [Limnohabitans sp.]